MIVSDNPFIASDFAQQLAQTLTSIDDNTQMQAFLCDVMTSKEILEMGARLEAAKMLKAGSTYAAITAKTKLSSRTIARISDWMQNGYGGYAIALQLTSNHSHIPPVRAA